MSSKIRETIVARATPVGRSAIAMIRLSGPDVPIILSRLTDTGPAALIPGQLRRARIHRLDSPASLLDDAMVVRFQNGRSYTGEESAEIHCHGNPLIVEEIIAEALRAGARLAEPGEFTKRAYLNGRLDLAEAESVGALIAAHSQRALSWVRQAQDGRVSRQLAAQRTKLLEILAAVEAELDFAEREVDDVAAVTPADLMQELTVLLGTLQPMIARTREQRFLRDGLGIVLAGRVNVGKSSLFNLLCGNQRALVDTQPGTTRDALEVWLEIGEVGIRLIDTAGIHDQAEGIEARGIELARRRYREAALILLLFDGSRVLANEDRELVRSLASLRTDSATPAEILVVQNKTDLPRAFATAELVELLRPLGDRCRGVVEISAQSGAGEEMLRQVLQREIERMVAPPDAEGADFGGFVSERQVAALEQIEGDLNRALAGLRNGFTAEVVTPDLRRALNGYSLILGKELDLHNLGVEVESILDRVFQRFCIGK